MDIINFRVSPDGEFLEFWVQIPEGPNYKGLDIDKIAIQDHNHYTISYPEKPQIELTISPDKGDLQILNQKRVIKRLPITKLGQLGLERTGLYFLYVHQVGIPAEDTPCVCNKETTLAVAVNLYPIYNKAIKSMYKYFNSCKETKNILVDLYIKKNMILDAVKVEDYASAIAIYNTILKVDLEDATCYSNCSKGSNIKIDTNCKSCK